MGSFNAISEVGNAIVRLLRDHLVPDVIANPDAIGLCHPSEKGDYTLGVCLYDVRESEEVRSTSMVNLGTAKQKYPPMYVSLFYMITAYSNGDVKYRASEEQKILGKVLQVLKDYAWIDSKTLQTTNRPEAMNIRIQMNPLSYEDKLKIWTVPNQAYKLSLYYKVAPVEIESEKYKDISRVMDMDLTVSE